MKQVFFLLFTLCSYTLRGQTTTYTPTQTVTPTGIVETKINDGDLICFGSTLQPDGKILTTGICKKKNSNDNHPLFLLRFLNNGLLDTLFGTRGVVIADLGAETQGLDVFALPDGKIAVVGHVLLRDSLGRRGYDYDVLVLRYLSNGSLDKTFGNGGTSIISLSPCMEEPTATRLLPNGQILISGYSCSPGRNASCECSGAHGFLIKTKADGTLDLAFGQNGQVKIEDAQIDSDIIQVYSLALLANGNIVAAAKINKPRLLSISPNGRTITFLDKNNWMYNLEAHKSQRTSRALLIQPTGKILWLRQFSFYEPKDANGRTVGHRKWLLTRYLPNGNIDSTFAQAGDAKLPLTFDSEFPYCLATNQTGSIFIGGMGFIHKLSPTGTIDTTFFKNSRPNAHQLGECYELNFLRDGSILTMGNDHMRLGRFFPDGRPDTKFGAPVRAEMERPAAIAREKWQSQEYEVPPPAIVFPEEKSLEKPREVPKAKVPPGRPNNADFSAIKLPNGAALLSRGIVKKTTPKPIKGLTGTIVLKVCINRAGKVISVENVASKSTIHDQLFLQQVMETAKEWEFSPAPEAEEKEYQEIQFRFAEN